MTKKHDVHGDSPYQNLKRAVRTAVAIGLCLLGCTAGGGDLADSGGMSGTGISQGSIDAFGSIFVNGVQWDVSTATIEIDGAPATENDLRVGMVVRVEGDFDTGNLSGTALRVDFDDLVEGPIASAPVETIPGVERQFSVLGRTVIMRAQTTVFDGGAAFAALAQDDVVEITGFVRASGAIEASRVSLRGVFPGDDDVDLEGRVANLVANPNGTGMFDLGSIVVRYVATTTFEDVTPATLANGDFVKVDGTLRPSGTEVDASEVELETPGLGGGDLDRVEIEGVAVVCPQSPDFCVGGVPVDTSMATFDPMGFVPMAGDRVEVEGPLVMGTLVADRVESEDAGEAEENVRIEAAVTSVDPGSMTLVVLGVTVSADGETRIEDDSVIGDESFMFGEIGVSDFLEIRGVDDGSPAVRATRIERVDATAGVDDVRLEGPVTAIDTVTPGLSILGQAVPLDPGTLYFDAAGQPRTEEQFFRNPGDVMLGDGVRAEDLSAASLSTLSEVDEVEIEDPI